MVKTPVSHTGDPESDSPRAHLSNRILLLAPAFSYFWLKMKLAASAIIKAEKRGEIAITPFIERNVNGCTVDLRLSANFRRYELKGGRPLELREDFDYAKFTRPFTVDGKRGIEIPPGGTVLAQTIERVTLPRNIAGTIEGRSRFARAFLEVHSTASTIHPGSDNVQVLEIINNNRVPVILYPGHRICQVSFQRLEGAGNYRGDFKRQKRV